MNERSGRLFSMCVLVLLVLGCGQAVEQKTSQASATGTATASAGANPTASPRSGGPRNRPVSRLASARGQGSIKLVYGPTREAHRREIVKIFREERLFEDVIADLNAGLVLPRNLEVRFVECGEVNAFHDPNESAILLCYELFDHFLNIFSQGQTGAAADEAGGKAVAALVFVFYHELGHALIDIYDLPITGREEDAVDQLATVMLLETWEGEDSELAILSSAEWFELDATEREEDPDLADEHSLEEQRYYNLVCWIYGSDPEYFGDVVDDWGLPAGRAERCTSEYERMSNSWGTLLGPHMRSESGTGP